ncbi:MAG: MATE family efflux transporter [Prevotella sp.]|nr:MATE family efflux transporter [Prevotella sp.]MBQ5579025.1 MATE family efflux transporter [Prevotella sp.]
MTHVNDMTVGKPTAKIVSFALPLIMGYILQQVYLIVDAAIVGRWIGVGALAAVGASSSIMFLIMGFCNGSCAGFSIPIAQSFGAKDYSKMRAYVANALRVATVIAVVLTVITCIFCNRILRVVNTPEDIFHDASVFLFLQFLTIPFTIAFNLLAGFIRALGNSRQPFYFLIAASLLNVLLDVLLILVIGLGVEGAGIATLLSQLFSALLCVIYIRKHLQVLIPTGSERAYQDKMVGRLLNAGIPMGLQFSITGIGIIMLQSANNALGTVYVAAFTASMRVKYLFTCVFENIGVAMATYCGQNVGAWKLQRIITGVRSAIIIMLAYFVFTMLIIYPFADEMMMAFVDNSSASSTAIVENAAMFMRIANYFYPVLGLLTILRYSIQGMGYSNLSMLSGVMEMIARCGVSLWIVPMFHFLGVCYGDPVAWVSADLFLIPAFIYVYRRLRKHHV